MRLRFADCIIDAPTRSLSRGGELIHVEPKVLDLLVLLAEHRERVVSKDELMDALWPDAVVGEAALSRLVKEARRAVGDDGTQQTIIRTFHRRGYRFVALAAETKSHPSERPKMTANRPREKTWDPSEARDETTIVSDAPPSFPDSRRPSAVGILWLFPDTVGWSVPKDKAIRVGRATTCDLVLPGRDVSRKHAEVYRTGDTTIIRDLMSRNGTFVNGERTDESPLTLGDIIRVGEWVGIAAGVPAPESEQRAPLAEVAPGLLAGPRMRRKLLALRGAAASDLPVVILGETGTGKGSVAAAMHSWSLDHGPLVTVACAARPDDFSLEEAFRKEVASVTGGKCTILLDSVGELPTKAQGELLRLLDEGTRGADGSPLRLRFISTTEQDLQAGVVQGLFRADLCARLSAVLFVVPPLRERVEEIALLFMHFLAVHHPGPLPAVQARLIEKLCLYDWPFNVRELEFVARYLLISWPNEASLKASLLPPHVRTTDIDAPKHPHVSALEELRAALRNHSGRLGPASRAAGLTRGEAIELMTAPSDFTIDSNSNKA